MVIFIIIFILIYGGINFYIGLRGWQNVGSFIPFLNIKVYWIVFGLVALSYIIARLGAKFMPEAVHNVFILIGSYYMAAMLYFTLILILLDIIRLSNRWIKYMPESLTQNPKFVPIVGFTVLILILGVIIYGSWNAQNPVVSRYDISINKSGGQLKELHAVMVSDVHLGNIIHNGRLVKMVDMVNGLKPDVVLFAGDLIDEDVGPFIKQNMGDTFKKIESKLGVYAVLGNHEYIGGNAEVAVHNLEEAGVNVLRDEWVEIADSLYIAGRDDLSSTRFYGRPRKPLVDLIVGINKAKPVILLDHQPSQLQEAKDQGIDLQLSGHTHRGQMFPNQFITSRIYEIDWGYLKKDNLQVIVSSGYGTWGPPIRVGNKPEVVDIYIHFVD